MSSILSTPSTPSPPSRVHTPTTPRFGYGDSWEPYSPRKSSRIAQRASQRTPSPRASSRNRNSTRIPPSSSDAITPAVSPQKKRQPAMDSVRRASNSLIAEGAANAADSLGINSSHKKSKSITSSSTMLPTPAKTPQKQPDEKSKANVRAIARNLFSEPEAVPSPKKRKAKKYTGLTLDSFTAENVEEPIEIFTDTRDRIPEADNTVQNPFFEQASSTPERDQSTRQTRSKQVYVPGEGKISIEEALKREDGIVYVFRGKRIFRKFSQDEDGPIDGHNDGSPIRANTRSSLKPRLLFPTKGKATTKASTDDEEAVTDIEDHVLLGAEDESAEVPEPETPTTTVVEKSVTPVTAKFTPVSPPSTARATRASTRMQAVGSSAKQSKPRNPFDGWRRSKSRASTQGQKREGEPLEGQDEASKRQRV
ncbi:uncharacterized protein GGS22DRAFT_94417 [Annulohypoxylon maeteangense]|uniref:uncharacterized protein n=1 Tax=Annulohypoxylon maeteangense TaxID=1927788 RepID=UPI0020079283|nr:uncharacterized protein GGS22DRAFT_94417 [Annulohypoxylon maeteangense]KAI0888193.1 hypothetical protein GGS22DRAFT_94417 [Annulohypoxylon maeteangense]